MSDRRRPRAKVLVELARTLAATLVVLAAVEIALRVTWSIRNSFVETVPLPYVVGAAHGPVPPWVDGLRVLQEDDAGVR